ncbi:putative Gar1/Naf1 RNA binding protein [Elsinoe australis]|uniref:H/ACA ribonucleoprotein complex non-core subunit NAF1 n=1 Tax=Elsinoe australis TaxID=40998 RepID=A0A4V6DTQ8_9PEZI|nr:putative Gar1/Naf1 RNA binding protein [Elsinoe australis]
MSTDAVMEDPADDYDELYGSETPETAVKTQGTKVRDDDDELYPEFSCSGAIPGLGQHNAAANTEASGAPKTTDVPPLPQDMSTAQTGEKNTAAKLEAAGTEGSGAGLAATISENQGVAHTEVLMPPGAGSPINPTVLSLPGQDPLAEATSKEKTDQNSAANAIDTNVDGKSVSLQTAAESAAGSTAPHLKQEPDREFIEAAQANRSNPEAEWQFDSSDAESSSSDSDSDSTSSDDSDEADGDYEMLDPVTAARMLMAEEGGDEDGQQNTSGNKGGLKTKNEQADEVVPKPDITVTEDMRIVPLGQVEHLVMNFAVVKAYTSGEYKVLESGSALCLQNRTVIGAVMETMGRVQEPLYTVAFTNRQEMDDMGIETGTKIFYVDKHSTFVFTEPLKGLKGTDASNIHDEEVAEDELDFSDDETESAWKKWKKQNRQAGRQAFLQQYQQQGRPNQDDAYPFVKEERTMIKYDDDDDDEEMYTPLARPSNYGDMMNGAGASSSDRSRRIEFDRGRGRGRGGRGGRGRGASRGDRGRRGGYQPDGNRGGASGASQPYQPQQFQAPQTSHCTPPAQPTFPSFPPIPPQQAGYVPFQVPPPPGWPQQQALQQPPSWMQSLQQSSSHATGPYQQPPQGAQPAYPQGSYVNPAYWNQGQNQGQHGQYYQGQAQAAQDQTAALQAVMQYFKQHGAAPPRGNQ